MSADAAEGSQLQQFVERNEDVLFAPLSGECLWMWFTFRRDPPQKARMRWAKLADVFFNRCTAPTPRSMRPWAERGMLFLRDRVLWRFRPTTISHVDSKMHIGRNIGLPADQAAGVLLFGFLNWYAALSKRLGSDLAGLVHLVCTYSLAYSDGM